MYNKIASIILNSGKNNNYAGEVFVSQPDATKERLAGKIFVLAEIEGKKSETQKIINFLVNIFDYNYYGDEKILLRDKIEGLKIENIFETVLVKVNQGLMDFLQEEHIRINPGSTNLTIGVIHENKLYFSNYGKNKAFLIFRRQGDFEILNIESNVVDEEMEFVDEINEPVGTKIFSAVINGEIPAHSYFLFTNEALPEYLSNRELVNIITKLPPMVAAEQIKNFLQKINSFAPFLGIIVKSTLGTGLNDLAEISEESEKPHQVAGVNSERRDSNRNAHNSISHLNYTEQKTESMLAPAGIINFKQLVKTTKDLLSKFKVEIPENKKVVKFYEDNDDTVITQAPPRDIKKIEKTNRESFLIKDKLVFKKQSYNILPKLWNIIKGLSIIITPNFWVGIYQSLRHWLKNLGKKDRILVGALTACFLVLVASIVFTATGNKTRLAVKQFDQAVTDIDNKQAQVDLYAAVNNETGATEVLNNSIELITSSSPQTKEQESKKIEILDKLSEQLDKIQKITKIDSFQEIVNTNSWNTQAGADNLVFLNDKLYIGDGLNKAIYNFNVKDSSRNQITLTDSVVLNSSAVSDSSIYYLADQKIVKVSDQTVNSLSVGPEKLQGESFIQIYNNSLYLLNKTDKQIYKYKTAATGFSARSNWLKDVIDLSQATDFKIDGKVTISQNGGDLIKFNKGQNLNYKTATINPAFSANKIVMTANNVYLLDLTNKRLISLTKDGALIKQYRLVKDNLKDFAVDEASKSIYILAGTSVYKFGL
jgi:hypothetical protein